MNIEEAKKKLSDINNSTATKHHKTLIAELCSVIKTLFNEIERIKSQPLTLLDKRTDYKLDLTENEKFLRPMIEPFVDPGKQTSDFGGNTE